MKMELDSTHSDYCVHLDYRRYICSLVIDLLRNGYLIAMAKRLFYPMLGLFLLSFSNTGHSQSGVDPKNLGKGDQIWYVNDHLDQNGNNVLGSINKLGLTNVQDLIDYEKAKGMKWIAVKCGDGSHNWSQFTSDIVTRTHTAGLKIFGWAYAYGNNSGHYGVGSTQSANINGEINVALNALALGADGFIIDAEIEYETSATRVVDATTYANAIKTNYPTSFLAHEPFPIISSHSGFPYVAFGLNCDAVMPQDYWGDIGLTPAAMVNRMNTEWTTWQNSLSGSNTGAIKPIIPVGQANGAVPGSEITDFVNALKTNNTPATAGGY